MNYKNIFIDSSSLFSSSKPVEALTSAIRELLKEFRPEYVTLAIPISAYPEFEKEVSQIVDAFGIHLLTAQSIASEALCYKKQSSGETLIATSNNAMCMLIDDSTNIFDLGERKTIDKGVLSSSLGIAPSQIPLFLSVCGHPALGINAIPFSNPAEVIKALQKEENVTITSEFIGNLSPLLQKNVQAHLDSIQASLRKLTPEPASTNSVIRRKPIDAEKLYAFYLKHKLHKWLPDEIREKHNIFLDGKLSTRSVICDSKEKIDQLQEAIKVKGSCAVFVDSHKPTSLISICVEQGDAFVLNLDDPECYKAFATICSSTQIKLVTNESKALFKLTSSLGIETKSLLSDIQMGAHVVDSSYGKLTFEGKVKNLTAIDPAKRIDYITRKDEMNYDNANAVSYMADMADLTLRVNRKLYQNLMNIGCHNVLTDLEIPLSNVLSEMEKTGVRIDSENLQKFGVLIDKKLSDLQQEITKLSGLPVNVNSPKEVGELLYEKLGLKAEGLPQDTSEEVLEKLSEFHPLPGQILNARVLSNMKSSYVDGLLKKVDDDTGRIYTTYQQDPATTGRLSSRDPNLQSIPARRKEARTIKRSFIAESNFVIYAADYSQVELRILAHLSGDQKLIRAFNEGKDIHRATAAEVLGIPESQVSKEQRRQAKAINFGLVYGKTAFGLAKTLGVTKDQAQGFIDKYFERYDGVKKYLDGVKLQAKKNGYITTILGRRIYTPNINSSDFGLAKKAERSAINAPVQGTAADIMKEAMVKTFNELQARNLNSKLIMQVHDELVLEVDKSELAIVDELVKRNMENVIQLDVPLSVDSDAGLNWEESHSLEEVAQYESVNVA